MKKYLKIVIISKILLINVSVFASMVHSFYSQVISSEYNEVDGSFTYEIKYKFSDTTTFVQNAEFDLPTLPLSPSML
jgi:hypothetical protein